MGISYNAGTNTITVTGYSEETPCTFEDIYNADVGGVWGVVTKAEPNVYSFAAKLIVSAGVLIDTNFIATWANGVMTGHYQICLYVKTGSIFRAGQIITEAKKSTRRGCVLHCGETSYIPYFISVSADSTLDLFSSFLSSVYRGIIGLGSCPDVRIWNCLLGEQVGFKGGAADADIFNTLITYPEYGVQDTQASLDRVFVCGKYGAPIYVSGAVESVVTDPYVRDVLRILDSYKLTGTGQIIDGDVDTWVIRWHSTAEFETGSIIRKHTVNVEVLDSDGTAIEAATVALVDADGTEVFSEATDAGGVISEQTVTRGYCEFPDANLDTDLTKDYSPHTLTIIMAGKKTYTCDFTLDRPIDWTVALEDYEACEAALTANVAEDSITGDVVEDEITADVED